MSGIYQPEEGKIFYDNIDIKFISQECIREKVLYIAQKSAFITASIRKNICFGIENVTEAELDNVCEIVKIKETINALPKKYETLVEEGGKNFSTGECQKMALARALLRNPQILILDEATSNVEKKIETQIYDSIKRERKGITIISVMHGFNEEIEVDNVIDV